MLLLNIDKSESTDYLYKQIYKQFKNLILNRKITANEKLPSKRTLANQLDVGINTVTNAYEQLLAEGYIYTIERSGYYVENIAKFDLQTDQTINLPDELKEDIADSQSESNLLSLSHMTADISKFPFTEWVTCKRQAIKRHQNELITITHPQGPYTVRETIAKLIRLTRGVNCVPEQIVVSSGTQPLIKQLMEIQKKQPIIAMENPGYSRISSLFKRMNLQVNPVPLDNVGIDMTEIKRTKANFVFVTPSHQFPTGKIMPISRRIELINWAQERDDRYIIEDDYDSEFKYQTDNIPSLQSLDNNQQVIYMGTFSKSLFPNLRISYMVLPIHFLKKYRKTYSDLLPYTNTLTLYTLHYFIKSGSYERHIRRMNNHYENKRKKLINHLNETFKQTIKINNVPAGLHFTATFQTNKTYEEIDQLAKQYKLEFYSIRRFLLNDNDIADKPIKLILGFANINIDDIPEAVERLYKIIV